MQRKATRRDRPRGRSRGGGLSRRDTQAECKPQFGTLIRSTPESRTVYKCWQINILPLRLRCLSVSRLGRKRNALDIPPPEYGCNVLWNGSSCAMHPYVINRQDANTRVIGQGIFLGQAITCSVCADLLHKSNPNIKLGLREVRRLVQHHGGKDQVRAWPTMLSSPHPIIGILPVRFATLNLTCVFAGGRDV